MYSNIPATIENCDEEIIIYDCPCLPFYCKTRAPKRQVTSMEGSLKIEITREVPEGGKTAFTNNQVYIKNDGKRFTDGKTLKLTCNGSYCINLELKPSTMKVENLFINSIERPINKQPQDGDMSSRFYKSNFNTKDINCTGHTDRDTLIISVHVVDVGMLMIPIQSKYYSEELYKNSRYGLPLQAINVDFLVTSIGNAEITNAHVATRQRETFEVDKPAMERRL